MMSVAMLMRASATIAMSGSASRRIDRLPMIESPLAVRTATATTSSAVSIVRPSWAPPAISPPVIA